MAAAIDSPPAPPTGVAIVPPKIAPKPAPAPTREIKLGAPSQPVNLMSNDPRPGSARDKISQALYKKAGAQVQPQPAPTPAPPPTETVPPQTETVPPETETAPPETETIPATTETTPAAPTEKGKVSPWKLVDQWKGKAADLEKQLVEAKTAAIPEQQKKEYLTQIEQLTNRNKALEDEMRFVNYEQSEEFKTKYDAPYQKAFHNFIAEMGDLVVSDPSTGTQRQVNANDVIALANLGLADARKLADELYGAFANDMMDHRKEIRGLYQARADALKEAKENGSKREQQRQEMLQQTTTKIRDEIAKTWTAVNESATKLETYGKFFTPVEGDQDGNQRLAKGFELVDRAFSENPSDPRLTPEERASVVKRHAAVRNRAAATGRLIAWLNQRDSRIAELEKELAGIKSSAPPTGGSPPAGESAAANGGTATSRMFAELHKRAH